MYRRFLSSILVVSLLFLAGSLSAGTFPQASSLQMTLSGSTGATDVDSLLLEAAERGVRTSLESRIQFGSEGGDLVEATLGDPVVDDVVFAPSVRFTAWLRISYGGQSLTTGIFVIGKDLEDILRSLPRRIEQSLRYDVLDILPQFEADLSLEYLWRNSLSSWVDTSKNQIRVGDRLLVVGSSGQAEALVAVSDLVVTDGRTTAVFDPLYRRAPQPGLPIVSGPAWSGAVGVSIASDLSGFGLVFSVSKASSWYPWSPLLKVGVWGEIDSSASFSMTGFEAYAMGGLQVDVPLGPLFETRWMFVEDASVEASCLLGAGFRLAVDGSSEAFIFGGEWEVGYRMYLSPFWSWKLGIGSWYWAQVGASGVETLRSTPLTITPSVVFNW